MPLGINGLWVGRRNVLVREQREWKDISHVKTQEQRNQESIHGSNAVK